MYFHSFLLEPPFVLIFILLTLDESLSSADWQNEPR